MRILKIQTENQILYLNNKYFYRAVDAGISIVNEVGLDPGIDHLLAMECFEEVQLGGGKVQVGQLNSY